MGILQGIGTALWEKWREFTHEWKKITISSLINPLLYMIALGWGLGSMVNTGERPYIDFLVPGIIALTTMNTGYSSVSTPLSAQRLFEKSFDQIIISPTPLPAYIIGQILGGALRGMYAGVLILLLSVPFGVSIKVKAAFFLIMLLNGSLFSALGVLAAVLANLYTDVSRFSSFVIVPMTFLCNTMFPIERLPLAVSVIIKCLPLTHASSSLRMVAYGGSPPVAGIMILLGYVTVFTVVTVVILMKRQNV